MKKLVTAFGLMWLLYSCTDGDEGPTPSPPEPVPPTASELQNPSDNASGVMEPLTFSWSAAAQSGAGFIWEDLAHDDAGDNRFYEPLGRYPEIIEDEPAEFYLCNEYPL